MQKIVTNLWYDTNAEEAAEFYISVFKNGRILDKMHYTDAGPGPAGTVVTVTFELFGQTFIGINGGPHFKFTPAISLMVPCDTQAEIDRLWAALSANPQAEQCGWLQDKYGLSWQIAPAELQKMASDPDRKKATNVTRAMLQMKKLDIAKLREAYRA